VYTSLSTDELRFTEPYGVALNENASEAVMPHADSKSREDLMVALPEQRSAILWLSPLDLPVHLPSMCYLPHFHHTFISHSHHVFDFLCRIFVILLPRGKGSHRPYSQESLRRRLEGVFQFDHFFLPRTRHMLSLQ